MVLTIAFFRWNWFRSLFFCISSLGLIASVEWRWLRRRLSFLVKAMAAYSEQNLDEPTDQWTVAWRRSGFKSVLLCLRVFLLCHHCGCGELRTVASMTTLPRKAKLIAGFLRAVSTTGLIVIRADWTSLNRFLFYSLLSAVIAFCPWWFTSGQSFLRSGVWWMLCVRWLLSGVRSRHNQCTLLFPCWLCIAFSP